ncbi:hypothetical protein CLIB1423_13S00144 [[Candida] railenensis]|uniref:Uncharacterized protein n=1 Tax=[Candida] railenensis TaxID=45579 RepID=A0A9P0VZS6_9ASCO|nr:hypothetical protein CLIB1423_13S00144 [[Candida] railenensis]
MNPNMLAKLLPIFLFNSAVVESLRFDSFNGQVREDRQYFDAFIAKLSDNPTHNASHSIIVESISMKNASVPIPDIPIFMYPFADLHKFNMSFDVFSSHPFKGDEDFSNVTVKDEFASDNISYYIGYLNTSQFNNANMDLEVQATLNVKENGEYSAVMRIPEEVEELHTKERIINSYGYLPFEVYSTLHSQVIYCIILTLLIVLMSTTFFKDGISADKNGAWFSISSVAIIFKYFFCFVYLPHYFSTIIRLAFNFYFNYNEVGSLYEDQSLLSILDWADHIINITERYIYFLLASGYGSKYAGPSSLPNPMPKKLWNTGLILYIANIVSFSFSRKIHMFVNKRRNIFTFVLSEFFQRSIDFTYLAMWMMIIVVNFFSNLKNLGKHSYNEKYSEKHIAKVAKSYKASIIPILIVPLVMRTIDVIITIDDIFSGRSFQIFFQDGAYFRHDYGLLPLWSGYLEKLSFMIFIYYFWTGIYDGIRPFGVDSTKQIKFQ